MFYKQLKIRRVTETSRASLKNRPAHLLAVRGRTGIRPLQSERCDAGDVLLSDRCQEAATQADTHTHTPQPLSIKTNREHSDLGGGGLDSPLSPIIGPLSTRTGLSLAPAQLSVTQTPGRISPFCVSFRKRSDASFQRCRSKTVFSLQSHQIFTTRPYSRSTVPFKRVMCTSCGRHGNREPYNNLFFRAKWKQQMWT